jgi:hypothetical protein
VFLDDFGGNRKAEAGAAMLSGVEGQKEALANFVGQAVPSVGDSDLNFAPPSSLSDGANAEDPQQAALHGFSGIIDEVGQGTAQRIGIGEDRAATLASRSRCTVMPSRRPANSASASSTTSIDVAGSGLGRGKLREGRELIDKGAQCSDACENDFAAFPNYVGRVGLPAVKVFGDALGRKCDGRERVFDLVGDALRNFLPCELALGAQEFRCVFNDEHGCLFASAGHELEAGAGNGQMNECGREAWKLRPRWTQRPCDVRGE